MKSRGGRIFKVGLKRQGRPPVGEGAASDAASQGRRPSQNEGVHLLSLSLIFGSVARPRCRCSGPPGTPLRRRRKRGAAAAASRPARRAEWGRGEQGQRVEEKGDAPRCPPPARPPTVAASPGSQPSQDPVSISRAYCPRLQRRRGRPVHGRAALVPRRRQRQSEPMVGLVPGVGGIVELAPGYLPAAYEMVRKAGGMCIADEVQAGVTRTGRHFWCFEGHGIIPDIVTMAKEEMIWRGLLG